MSKFKLEKAPDHLFVGVLDAYPRIVEAIKASWSTSDLLSYVNGLLISDKPDRAGFPLPVFTQLNIVLAVHNRRFPHLENQSDSHAFRCGK